MAIHYCRLDEFWTKYQKFNFLIQKKNIGNLDWKLISPDSKQNWITEGLHLEFDNFIAMGSKEGKADKNKSENVIFKIYSGGIKTNRDVWACNFNQKILAENMQKTIDFYNQQVFAWSRNQDKNKTVDDFVNYDDKQISWDSTLKNHLRKNKEAHFDKKEIRTSLYRPFIKSFLYFDKMLNNSVHRFFQIFPTVETEKENLVICCTNHSQIPFVVHITNVIPEVANGGRTGQCFPFYVYDEEGNNRRENITDWALEKFKEQYSNLDRTGSPQRTASPEEITKRAIFYYVYGLLHAKNYREKYAQNLKKELPRIPFVKDFWFISNIGKELAELHLNYESAQPFDLETEINEPIDWKVDKMRLSKDKKKLVYNQSITFLNIPEKVFDYKLGNRSALEWIIDQYRIKIDERSGIINDPNQVDNERYIIDLIGKIITVSIKTVDLTEQLDCSLASSVVFV